jgi:hypothetical protein
MFNGREAVDLRHVKHNSTQLHFAVRLYCRVPVLSRRCHVLRLSMFLEWEWCKLLGFDKP